MIDLARRPWLGAALGLSVAALSGALGAQTTEPETTEPETTEPETTEPETTEPETTEPETTEPETTEPVVAPAQSAAASVSAASSAAPPSSTGSPSAEPSAAPTASASGPANPDATSSPAVTPAPLPEPQAPPSLAPLPAGDAAAPGDAVTPDAASEQRSTRSRGSWSWATPLDTPSRGGSKDAEPVELAWRGTALIWGHALTTSSLGVGDDYQSTSHQVYLQNYALRLNYHVLTNDAWDVQLALVPALELELTDSAATTQRRELWLVDLPVSAVATWLLAKDDRAGTATALTGDLTTYLPASKASRAAGHILTFSPRVGATQRLPLLGRRAPVFQSLSINGSLRWDHLLSEANTPVDEELDSPGQDLGGSPLRSDLLSGERLAPNTFRGSLGVGVSQDVLRGSLDFGLSVFYQSAQLYDASAATVELPTGPYEVPAGGRGAQPVAGVGAEVSFAPTPEVAVSVGYVNAADLGSSTPNPLYTPGAQFVAGLSLALDALYLRAQGRSAPEPEPEPALAATAAGASSTH